MTIAKTPPEDKAAERLICATILANPKILSDVWPILVEGEVFFYESYCVLAKCLHQLWNDEQEVRLLTVMRLAKEKGWFERLPPDLSGIESEGFGGDYTQNALYLRELWIRRQAIKGAGELHHRAHDLTLPTDELVGMSGKLSDRLSSGLVLAKEKTFKSTVRESLLRIEAAMKSPGGIVGVPAITPKLNRFMGGWQKCVHAIGGRPGMGKTVVAVLSALEAGRNGIASAYVSLEVSRFDLVYRMYSEMALIPYGRIKRGQISNEQFAQIQVIVGQIEDYPIHIYDDPERDISVVRNWLIDIKRRHNIELVVVDYAQLLEDKTKKGDTEEMTSISKHLLKLQRRLDVAMLEFLQLNREVEKRGSNIPNQADIKQTGQFEQDAEVVILLYRDDYYKQKRNNETGSKEAFDNKLEMIFDKNRNGETGSLYFHIDVAHNRILDDAPIAKQAPATTTDKPSVHSFNYSPVDETGF